MANFDGFNSKTYHPVSMKAMVIIGSQLPALKKGTLRIYNMRFCPFAHRTMLTLAAKNIPVEVINVNLKQKPEWLLAKNPTGKVPVLEIDDRIVYESLVCNEWLDGAYPDTPAILPTDPDAKAHERIIAERLSGFPMALFGWLRNKESEEAGEKVQTTLDLAESLLTDAYYSGKAPGFADYAVWPFLERMEVITLMSEGALGIQEKRHPKLTAYYKRMMATPAVKETYRSGQEHLTFLKTATQETPDYDSGITAA